ncbi:uncharacterized protein LOC111694625 [Trichogramma pretiosum]|uniref:uncharacterized protein LOC111694625 n=1 Tax=Trichogramma pretiosum TaxID=7493 RepID=UPI000C718D4D|nr:uncharacterized protein LOC111694625 [Trichogramma pretiosum]
MSVCKSTLRSQRFLGILMKCINITPRQLRVRATCNALLSRREFPLSLLLEQKKTYGLKASLLLLRRLEKVVTVDTACRLDRKKSVFLQSKGHNYCSRKNNCSVKGGREFMKIRIVR